MSDRFTKKTYVGSGAMATVYRAWDSVMQRDVALKEIADELQDNADVRELLLNEARKIAKIKHPNVVQIYDVTYDDGIPTIVQEFVGGGDLASSVGSSTASVDVTLKVLHDVFSGLDAIHSSGLIHRDIKPDNLLNGDGTWKLVDFGVAMQGDEDVIPFVGSKYAAPEILLAPETISAKSDFYSAGVMAMEMLLGSATFERVAREVTAKSTGSEGPENPNAFWQKWSYSKLAWPRLEEVDKKFSAQLSDFIAKLIAHEADARPVNAAEVLAALNELRDAERQILSAPTLPLAGSAPPASEGAPKKKKQPLWFKAIAGVLLVCLLGLGALLLMPTQTPLSVATSTEAATLARSILAETPPAMTAVIRGTQGGDGPQTMEIGRAIALDVTAQNSGQLALVHLSADHALSVIYPSPTGELPSVEANVTVAIGDDLRLEVSEPTGTEYWLVLNTAEGLVIPESVPMISVEDWARAFLIGDDPVYSARLVSWLANQPLTGWALIEVNVVALADNE